MTPAQSPAKTKDLDGSDFVAGKSRTLSQQLNKTSRHVRTEEEIMRASLHDLLKDQSALKPFRQPIDVIFNRQAMEALQEDVLTIEDLNEFHNYQDMFEDSHDAASEVFISVV